MVSWFGENLRLKRTRVTSLKEVLWEELWNLSESYFCHGLASSSYPTWLTPAQGRGSHHLPPAEPFATRRLRGPTSRTAPLVKDHVSSPRRIFQNLFSICFHNFLTATSDERGRLVSSLVATLTLTILRRNRKLGFAKLFAKFVYIHFIVHDRLHAYFS